jgi:formate dehydrogenase maturation protein FdhE
MTDRCPACGAPNPAAQNRSDGVVWLRCDVCKHEWQAPLLRDDKELPPVPAIDAPGG